MTSLTPRDREILREAAEKIVTGKCNACCFALRNAGASASLEENFSEFCKPRDEKEPFWFGELVWGQKQIARSLALLFLAEMREGEMP